MGNGFAKVTVCFTGIGETHSKHVGSAYLIPDPSLDEGLGHSFCYIRPDPIRLSSSKVYSSEDDFSTTFRSISGAAVSANTSTSLSTDPYASVVSAAAFESSTSFASLPLQPIPKLYSDPGHFPGSGPLERGFLSGPIERGFMSGPLDNKIFSGPIEIKGSNRLKRSFSHGFGLRSGSGKTRVIRVLQRVVSKTISRGQSSIVAPIKGFVVKEPNLWVLDKSQRQSQRNELTISSEGSLDDEECNVEWAQGKAGEDRVHVVVSEEHGWVFVGIYDGFNGPDAPDFLLSNLYNAVHREVKGLLWDDKVEVGKFVHENVGLGGRNEDNFQRDCGGRECAGAGIDSENYPCVSGEFGFDSSLRRKRGRGKYRGVARKWEENQRRWKCEFDRERMELDRRLKEQLNNSGSNGKSINHGDVLKALSQALKKTEESYLDIADKMLMENPELSLMGSCVLVMLMKGEDVYVMNVGDSRAVLAQKAGPDYGLGKVRQDLERINEETLHDLEAFDGERSSNKFPSLTACQLTVDHSTSVEEEVQRIRNEHPDDAGAVMNDRVKGSLKVTRAFGAGFLKQPKWNDALLEMFRIDYVGKSPYINCLPSLHHHRVGPKDRFLILCSDGLYQYLTNEEAVNEVELFIALQPEGDPAQHLVEEVLFRAAKRAGMDFHELLEIPQGDRRRYHDDISIIVISLEGRIWRSCV